jgi:uncharacterized protein YkwD
VHGRHAAALAATLITLGASASAHADPLVISEVLPGGTAGEYVEVFNASDADVALSGWTVEVGGTVSSFCTTDQTVTLPDATLPPGGHVLVGTAQGADVAWSTDSMTSALGWASVTAPRASAPADRVQWGDISGCGEGGAAASPGTAALGRIGGWQDTGDNAADFEVLAAPGPQNLASTPTPKNPPAPPAEPPAEPQQPGPTTGSSDPAETPPPAGPVVETGAFATPPVAGRPATLVVEARDLASGISGVELDFGDGTLGMSACQQPAVDSIFGAGQDVRFEIPHTFARPGVYTVVLTVRAGACGVLPRDTVQQLQVVVGAAKKKRKAKGKAAARKKCASNLVASARTKAATARAVTCLMNVERRARGLAALRMSKKLLKIARGHNSDMMRRHYFLHEHPSGPTLLARMVKAKYVGFMGENLGYFTAPTAKAAVDAWMASPLHKANILQPRFRFAAVAVAIGAPKEPGPPMVTMTVNFGDNRR